MGDYEVVRSLFEEKTKQLIRIEDRMDENERPGLTSIPLGTFFAATYVLKFSRSAFEPKKYQVGFDAIYSQLNEPARRNSIATNVQISPYPLSLSFVAILSAFLGVVLRLAISNTTDTFVALFELAKSGQLLVGPIVAVIFFNVYEHTSIGKGLSMSLSWRSALLIGALSGIAQDRILSSLKALIGV